MADEIRPIPRSPILGLFSDLVNLPLQYMSAPQRTQQMQGVAEFIRGTGVPSTLERLSYGQGLFTGAGGLGGTTRLRPEVAEAALTVAPMVGPASRLAGRAVMATRGLPVGASIKNVGKIDDLSYRGSHTAPGPDFGAPLYDLTGGGQMYPADVYSAKAAQYYGTGFPKADREAFALAQRVRGNPDAEVTMYRAVPKDENITSINAGDWVTLSKDYAKTHGESALRGDYKILSQKVKAKDLWTNADSIHEFGYQPSKNLSPAPQEEALRLAQQRAALPVSEGGLGLPPDNTPMDRARAMGFDTPSVHFSRHGIDANVLDSGKFAIAPFDSIGTHVGSPQAALERFNNTVGFKVGNPAYSADELKGVSYPVLIKSKNPKLAPDNKPYAETPLTLELSGKADYGNLRGSNQKMREEIFSKYDSIPYVNDVEAAGSLSYIAPPQNIRSRFAAFDPTRRNEPDLLAGALPFTVLIDEENRRAMDEFLSNPIMYRDPFGSTAR